MLLSPELFLPRGCRLEGDPLLFFEPLLFFDPLLSFSFPAVALEALLSLDVSLSLGLFRLCDECFNDTDRCAGGRRGCPEGTLSGCSGGVITIIGSLEAICGEVGGLCYVGVHLVWRSCSITCWCIPWPSCSQSNRLVPVPVVCRCHSDTGYAEVGPGVCRKCGYPACCSVTRPYGVSLVSWISIGA